MTIDPITLIASAYHDYVMGWQTAGTRSGACLAIVEDLVSAGLVVDDAIGEASIEARIERVLSEHVIDHDGRVNDEEFAEAVAEALGLVDVGVER